MYVNRDWDGLGANFSTILCSVFSYDDCRHVILPEIPGILGVILVTLVVRLNLMKKYRVKWGRSRAV